MRLPLVRITSAITAITLCSSLTLSAFAQQKDPAKLEEAKKHMEAGAAFYNDPSGHKCEEAVREFKAAYDLSGSLNALKGMGVCDLELERDGEAISAYETYMKGKGAQIDAGDKAQMESDLAALKSAVSYLTLRSDKTEFRITDVRTPSRGFPVTNRYPVTSGAIKLGLHPGQHLITASADGAPDISWKVEISNGGKFDHMFDFAKAAADLAAGNKPKVDDGSKKPDQPVMVTTRPTPTSVYVVGGLTVALIIPTVIFMVKAKGDKSTYDADNGKTADTSQLQTERSTVQTSNLLADIFLGSTVVAGVVTTALYATRATKTEPAKPGAASWTFTPTVGRAGGGAALTGTF